MNSSSYKNYRYVRIEAAKIVDKSEADIDKSMIIIPLAIIALSIYIVMQAKIFATMICADCAIFSGILTIHFVVSNIYASKREASNIIDMIDNRLRADIPYDADLSMPRSHCLSVV